MVDQRECILNKPMKNNQINEYNTLFFKHLPLLMEKREQIVTNPNYFIIPIHDIHFYGRACLVAGRVKCLPLGVLLNIWAKKPITTRLCNCGGIAVIINTDLLSLSSFTFSAICLQCCKITKVKETGSSSHISSPFFAAQRAYSNITSVPSIELEALIKILKQNIID
jgi:hypothetical protein